MYLAFRSTPEVTDDQDEAAGHQPVPPDASQVQNWECIWDVEYYCVIFKHTRDIPIATQKTHRRPDTGLSRCLHSQLSWKQLYQFSFLTFTELPSLLLHCDFSSAWTSPSYSTPVQLCSVDLLLIYSNWKGEENLVRLLYLIHLITQPYAYILPVLFYWYAKCLDFHQSFQTRFHLSIPAHPLTPGSPTTGIHLNVSNCFAMHLNFCLLLSLASSHHQGQMLLAVISQITKGPLKFSGVGVGFFVM